MNALYQQFFKDCASANIDWAADTIKVALLNSSHTFTYTNTVWSDVSANEISGTEYTSGGQALTNAVVELDTSANQVFLKADDVTWGSEAAPATLIAYYAVLYNATRGNKLIASLDFGGEQQVTSGAFKIAFNSSLGVITLK